jgi:hypothetical protein
MGDSLKAIPQKKQKKQNEVLLRTEEKRQGIRESTDDGYFIGPLRWLGFFHQHAIQCPWLLNLSTQLMVPGWILL